MFSFAPLKMASILIVVAVSAHAAFDPCKFNVGVDLKQASSQKCNYLGCTKNVSDLNIPTGVDFVSEFVGYTDEGSGKVAPKPTDNSEGTFLAMATTLNATPVWYTYIIAEGAKLALGLSDCNMGSGKTLCTDGAGYIRNSRSTILSQYTAYAQFAANKYGANKTMIWALEPDFYQYASGQNGNSNPLSFSDAAAMISDIASAITSVMPGAVISMDISPWAPDNWFTSLPLSKFTYMNTSGGVSQPGNTVANGNPMTWSHIHSLTGKPIIADDGYGTGGGLTSPNSGWSNTSNIQSRLNDGVVGLSEAYPTSSWTSTISSIHSISGGTACRVLPKYTLTLSSGTGGSVSNTPTGTSFDSGTVVKLTATAAATYTFSGWSGAVTGTKDTISVVMNANKSVTGSFTHTLPKYTLAITQLGTNATIKATPTGPTYDSGARVGLKATPSTGYQFASWTGDAAGLGATDSVTLVMNSNKSVSATTTKVNGILDAKRLGFRMGLHGDQLVVSLGKTGAVHFSLISIDGKDLMDLGTVEMQGQEQIFGVGNRSTGVHFVRMRGEGWESVVRLPVLSR